MPEPERQPERHRYELRIAVRGRARFLSHLECVDMLLAALRRVGAHVALSEGMRPKPVISLALARAVGVEAEDEPCTVALQASVTDLEALRRRLDETLPRGVEVTAIRPSTGRPVVRGARYRVGVDAPPELLARAVEAYAAASEAPVRRRSPKGLRTVDVRRFAHEVHPIPGGLAMAIALTDEGSARPEEVVRALEQLVAAPLPVTTITRSSLLTATGPPLRAGERT